MVPAIMMRIWPTQLGVLLVMAPRSKHVARDDATSSGERLCGAISVTPWSGNKSDVARQVAISIGRSLYGRETRVDRVKTRAMTRYRMKARQS